MKVQPTFLRRVVEPSMAVRAVVALGLAAAGVGLGLKDRPELERETRLRAERTAVVAQQALVTQQLAVVAAQLTPERERLVQTEKVLGELRQLQSTWEWAVGNREQQRANNERIEKLEATHAVTVARVATLTQQQARTGAEHDQLENAREQIDANLRLEETRKAAGSAYHVRRAWLRIRGWLLVGAGAGLLGWAVRAATRSGRGERRVTAKA